MVVSVHATTAVFLHAWSQPLSPPPIAAGGSAAHRENGSVLSPAGRLRMGAGVAARRRRSALVARTWHRIPYLGK